MRDLWLDAVIASQNKLVKMREEWMDESGAENMVGTIIMIVVIIAVAAIFKNQLIKLVEDLFTKIGGFVNDANM